MRRALSIATAAAAAAALMATSLHASAAPAKTVIEDPLGDANFVNDQGTGDGTFGDQNAADAGTVSDITGIQLMNDAKNLYVTIQTEAAPPAATGIGFAFRVNPGDAGSHCIYIEAFYPGANNILTAPVAQLRDTCAGGDPVSLKVLGTQVVVPRKSNPAFGKGAKLTSPQAQSFLYWGNGTQGFGAPYADTTKVGTDYTFVDKKKG